MCGEKVELQQEVDFESVNYRLHISNVHKFLMSGLSQIPSPAAWVPRTSHWKLLLHQRTYPLP